MRSVVLPTRASHPALWADEGGNRHEPQARNARRMNGSPRLDLDPGRHVARRPQGGGGGAFIVRNGVYVPLQYTDPGNPLMGGYGFCDWTDQGMTPHPGVDLNSGAGCNDDEGAEVVAATSGVVLAILAWDGATSGEGNHLWVLYDSPPAPGPTWAHFDHLLAYAPGLVEGQRFAAGQLLGYCGRTGNWDCSHLHCELARYQPASWWQWPYAWTIGQVQAFYYDPYTWYQAAAADAAGGGGDDVRSDTTPEEREAVRPYFEMYGYAANMDSALLKRFCLSYYRDESPGPLLSDEYPATAPDGTDVTRQKTTGRIGEAKPQPDGTWWTGYVEVVAHPESLQ